MRSPNDIFCLIGKRGAGKDALADALNISKTTISDILTQYCKQHNLIPDRNTLTELGNSIFDGQTLAHKLQESLPQGGIITGLRKPETLYHLMQQKRCLLIGVFADDYLRRQRVTQRNRLGDTMSYRHFLEHERQENAPPNKQNIELLTAFCDLHIKNNDSLESYIIQGKQALQKVLTRPQSPHHIDANGYIHFTRAILINECDEILVMYDTNKKIYTLPGGKVDAGETPDITILRELQEEINITTKLDYCGSFPGLFYDGRGKGHFFEGVIKKDSITILEPENHSEYRWIPRKELDQTLGFTTFLDTGLYHYTYNQRVHNRDTSRTYDIDSSRGKECIQYIHPLTGVIHIGPWLGTLNPMCIPLRIMSYEKICEGLEKQKERIGTL